MSKKIEFSDDDLKLVSKALDLFIRAHMGRADQVMEPVICDGVRFDGKKLAGHDSAAARELLERASEVLTGVRYGGPGIFSNNVPEIAVDARLLKARIDGDQTVIAMLTPVIEIRPVKR
jgi:hypothetical protein